MDASERQQLADRIWKFVIPEPNTGCWLWLGCVSDAHKNAHRAKVQVNSRTVTAARLAYEVFKGPIGKYCVLHRCDTPLCVNPDHLWLGTHSDNMRDMLRKGRRTSKANGLTATRKEPRP